LNVAIHETKGKGDAYEVFAEKFLNLKV